MAAKDYTKQKFSDKFYWSDVALSIHTERVDDVSDDESERECDDDTTVCDDHDVTGTNGEVSNPDDGGARNVPDLCDLFE